jgi:hypothetical protein
MREKMMNKYNGRFMRKDKKVKRRIVKENDTI